VSRPQLGPRSLHRDARADHHQNGGSCREGVASAADIDAGMKLGCSHPIGPLALADLIGLDTLLSVMEVFQRDYGDPKYRPAPLLRELVAAGRLGRKSGQGIFSYS